MTTATLRNYGWKPGGRLSGGDVQDIGELIDHLRHGNEGERKLPHAVVKEARKKRSPLHQFFEWDDRAAAEQHIEAARIAEKLLRDWFPKDELIPRGGSGEVEGEQGWYWRTKVVESESAEKFGGEIVALEVFSRAGSDQSAAVRVELLVPKRIDDEPKRIDAD